MKKLTALLLAIIFTMGAFAQKRNLIANSRFEEGYGYKNWRRFGSPSVTYTSDSITPIAGSRTAKIVVNATLTNTWDATLRYYHPIVKGARYQLRFKVKATGTDSLYLELCENHDAFTPIIRQRVKVSSEVREVVLNTTSSPSVSDWNWTLAFHFGQLPVGATYWLDDVSLTQIDGDWDGNLIPNGSYDQGLAPYFDYYAGSLCTIKIDSTNQISNNSLNIKKTVMGDNSFWGSNLGWWCYWANEGVYHEFSFKGKAKAGSTLGKLDIRTAHDPWSGADSYSNDFDITETTQTFVLNKTNNPNGRVDPVSTDYTSDWYGRYKFFGGLNLAQTPVGFDVFIDDLMMKEIVSLKSIEIDAHSTVNGDTSFNIWANPTHASNNVNWSIINGTGSAGIDTTGHIYAAKDGIVTVVAVSKTDQTITASKTITVHSPKQASNLVFSNIKRTSASVKFQKGYGSKHAIFVTTASTGTASPADNKEYSIGEQIGSTGWVCKYAGSADSVLLSGLTANAETRVMVCDYFVGTEATPTVSYITISNTANPASVTTTNSYIPQTISFTEIPRKSVRDADFNLIYSASSGLPITITNSNTSVASVSGTLVHIKAKGTAELTATQAGNDDYAAATPTLRILNVVDKYDQKLTFTEFPNKTFGDAPFYVRVKNSTGLKPAFKCNNSAVAVANDSLISIVGAGSAYIVAYHGGNDTLNPVIDSVALIVKRGVQNITTATSLTKYYGGKNFKLSATALDGAAISFSLDDNSILDFSGDSLAIKEVGTTTVNAVAEASTNYEAATKAITVTVKKAQPIVTFKAIESRIYGYGSDDLLKYVVVTENLPVRFVSLDSNVATVSSTTITYQNVGTAKIRVFVTQSNSHYEADTLIGTDQLVSVTKADQTIKFDKPATVKYGDSDFALVAKTKASSTIEFVTSNPSVISVNGSTASIKNAGAATITAKSVADRNFEAATDVSYEVTVNKATLTIKVADTSRLTGTVNPKFTLTYKGFVGTDTEDVLDTLPRILCSALQTSPADVYDIFLEGGGDNNYEYRFESSRLIVKSLTSVANAANTELNLYPNPVSDILTISPASKVSQVDIYSLSGLLIQSETTNGASSVNVQALPAGSYIVKLKTGNSVVAKQIIKQ